jgi:hypothetical protein
LADVVREDDVGGEGIGRGGFFTIEYTEAVEPYLKDTETGLEGLVFVCSVVEMGGEHKQLKSAE